MCPFREEKMNANSRENLKIREACIISRKLDIIQAFSQKKRRENFHVINVIFKINIDGCFLCESTILSNFCL